MLQTKRHPVPGSAADNAYGTRFWLLYAANTSMLVALSVLFRYADFVTLLGGSEAQLGWIVGLGTLGALAMRVFQGVGIDRHGPRRIWLLSLTAFIASMLAHLLIGRVDGVAIFVTRFVMMASLAGAFGASISFISMCAPPGRMAEMIGTLGSSGFVGMAIGPIIGDWLVGVPQLTRAHVNRMFLLAALLATLALVCVGIATRGAARPGPRRPVSLLWLLRRYHPGSILLMGVAVGIGLGLPFTFLPTFVAELGIPRIRVYFLVYAATAFSVRVLGRHIPDRLGIRNTLLLGQTALVGGLLLFLTVTNEWLLMGPAVFCGTAHALLFPAVVAGGSAAFPDRYRGLGTTYMLAMFDLGGLIGPPMIGTLLMLSGAASLPRYPATFMAVAAAMALTGVVYAWASARGTAATVQRTAVRQSVVAPAPPAVALTGAQATATGESVDEQPPQTAA